ncbi:hypothetical protein DB313_04795 (plasmid) [Borrelia turcica IST7]|uniref:Mlp family lipoprotein n=1 Tax=Borrelia turcica IST7 TaxID=1104446 RepID=A0A386PPZ6_9SPIR|nr:Mlp family lipoprotein [Borrelia turcica]AYE36820.1 hypothetical protein DB313_04795 [Borrelia turcica IST7]
MGRVKYVVVFLLLLVVGCKQYNGEVENKSEGLKAKIGDGVIEEGEGKDEVKKTAEETLREKLNDKQKKGLNFLKEALGDEAKLNKLLGLEESKVIEALEHIQKQLDSCASKNHVQEGQSSPQDTFKTLIKAYFDGDSATLDNVKTNVVSTCDANGS